MSTKTQNPVRVRIAPSPTGPLHIGTARTALFNYLFAKKAGGSFLLRIEDTDLERSDKKFEKDIINNLKWLGIKWDEKTYYQSKRLSIYAKYLERLLKDGKAYYCFCSEEELEAKRQYFMGIGKAPIYSGKCGELSEKEVKEKLGRKENSIIRFRAPEKIVKFKDLIRGALEFDSALIGDFSIAKGLSSPLYNFAVVIDDFEMGISHVIRGEDHISNTPKQILLQEAFGFHQPEYAHLPLILGPDRSKLSKRHGVTSIADYKKAGYLSDALINFMAFLGWNPGDQREIFSLNDLEKEFSLEKVQKAGAVFNISRLDYLNGYYIRKKPLKELVKLSAGYLKSAGLVKSKYDAKYLAKVIGLYQGRLKKLSELPDLVDFAFKDGLEYGKELLKWKNMTDQEVIVSLDILQEILSKISPKKFTKENLEEILLPVAQEQGSGDRGKLLWPLRAALTGKESSAGPFEIAEVLGKIRTLKRIKEAGELMK
ncbi:MAG: glutamate--tRNA ligase [Candidatus Nealsonbacteria bacterium]|nr:glutamate--tRNA ligase [Candidatus Nealsonbacteria bacterium]